MKLKVAFPAQTDEEDVRVGAGQRTSSGSQPWDQEESRTLTLLQDLAPNLASSEVLLWSPV